MTSSWILMRHGPDRPPSWLPQGWIPNARNVLELAPGGNPVRAPTIHFAPRTDVKCSNPEPCHGP